MEPAEPLCFQAEGKAWLDDAAQVYPQRHQTTRVSVFPLAATVPGGSSGGAVTNSEESLNFQASQHEFAYLQINLTPAT